MVIGSALLNPWPDECSVQVKRIENSMDKRWLAAMDFMVTADRGRENEAKRIAELCRVLMGPDDSDGKCESLRNVDANLTRERGNR